MITRYGPWAVIAGASEGIGAAFARALADRGLRLVVIARRPEPLAALASALPVETRTVSADLATRAGLDAVFAATADLEVGLVVANAAISPIGPFAGQSADELERALDLNCRAPLLLAHHYLPGMMSRRHGGMIIMSSLAGAQGSPGLAAYAATKAFDAVLAEGLWAEARKSHVDVLTCVAGAVATPGLAAASSKRAPGTVTPETVAATALAALGRKPRVTPGGLMKVSAGIMSRLSRRMAISVIERGSRDVLN